MIAIFILTVSIVLQFLSAWLAFRLIRLTGRRVAWGLIAASLFMMGLRRAVSLLEHCMTATVRPLELYAETLGLLLSACMLLGIKLFRPAIEESGRAEELLHQREQVFRALAENSQDIVARYDRDCRRTYANPVWETLTQVPQEECPGTAPAEHSPLSAAYTASVQDMVRSVVESGRPVTIDLPLSMADGTELWFNVHAVPEFDRDGRVVSVLSTSRDMTARKHAEQRLERLNRELRAVSNCNQTLLRASDEQTLLDEICRIVCDEAGYRLAWVGFPEQDDARTVRPVAWAGVEDGYLALARLSWSEEVERGRGPAGTAIRSGETVHVQDFTTAPQMAPWREGAQQRGYRSCIALPLKDESARVLGIFLIYSSEPHAFTQDEVRLLEGLVGDLAFGITALRTRAMRQRAEQALSSTAIRLHEAQRIAHLGSWELDLTTNTLTWSDEIYRIFEIDPEEFGASYEAFLDAIHPDDRETVHLAYTGSLETRTPYALDHRLRFANGRVKFVRERCETFYENDRPLRSVGTVQEITDHVQAEQERQAHLHFLESLEQVDRAMQRAGDLERVMRDVLDVVLSVYGCDRAWLLYPCDPDAASWSVPMERTRSEYPGVHVLGLEIPMDVAAARVMRTQLAAVGAVTYGPQAGHPLPEAISRQFAFASQVAVTLHPKAGKPWLLGLHQCSHAREWTAQEERLLLEVGRRLADVLTTLLANRDLRKSEERFRLVFENSPVSIWEEDFSGVKALFDALRQKGVTDLEAFLAENPEATRQFAEAVKVVDVNRATVTLHGAASKDELLTGLVRTFTPESFDAFRQELVCLWGGGTEMVRDAVVKTLDGDLRQVTVYFTVCPGQEPTLSRVLVSLIDITERKRAEDDIRTLNQELDLRVRHRTAELESKNEELERANRLFVGRELRMIELKEQIRVMEDRSLRSSRRETDSTA